VGKLFGIPVGSLTVAVASILAAALVVIAALAVRNRVFFRLGVRNVRRRPGRSALIVTGLMLGTTIITAALATGDTMSHTIRSVAVTALGPTDEVVAARGVGAELAVQTGGATASRYFPESYVRVVRAAGGPMLAGAAPVIVEPVAVQDATSRQNEPRVTLFASDPAQLRGFGDIRSGSSVLTLGQLESHEVYLNAKGADALGARVGDRLRVLTGDAVAQVRVRAIVHYAGGGTDGAGILMPLRPAQKLFDKPGLVRAIFVANAGGVGRTDEVIARLRPAIAPLGLEADNTKQDAIKSADAAGSAFMSIFTTFGSFSIAAGILLIFLIFVMLAAERRAELGIARAVGTQRRHLVQMFLYEGAAYDVIAALVGAAIGVAVAYGMVLVMASAFAATADLEISYSIRAASIVLAAAVGVLMTLAVVTYSAWRVSRMNIVSAIRSLPEPAARRVRRRRRLLGVVWLLLGGLLIASGVSSRNAVPLGLGVSLVVLGFVPILQAFGLPERLTHTTAGLTLVAWFVFPFSRWLLGDLKVDFSIFLLGGLMIVIGATWTIMYNADVLLGVVGATLGRVKSLAPVLRMSMAYPLRSLFRTGVTLAMFTLVVFTLVVGATTTGSFVNGFNDVKAFGGGFDVRATTSPAAPILDMRRALTGGSAADVRLVSSESALPIEARQVGAAAKEESYLVNGADAAFLAHNTYSLAARAHGYASTAAVWAAVRAHRGLAVVDQFAVMRKANWGTQVAKFHLTGFYLEDKTFAPVRVVVRDAQTGKHVTLTVIGVLSDTAPPMLAGIWTSQDTMSSVFGARALPTTHLFALQPGTDAKAFASSLESSFLANGMQADSLKKLQSDTVAASLTFDRLIMGFMGLGLIVGVAALGVITARAVVERRQQIGVLRAIGFTRRMVQASFLIESSFIALTSIVVGSGLGLAVAYGVISDTRRTPSWEGMAFTVPWVTLAIVFVSVYVVALVTTLLPAVRAARVYPAEALRYQ
jgi:putative ABC transport system permease protein